MIRSIIITFTFLLSLAAVAQTQQLDKKTDQGKGATTPKDTPTQTASAALVEITLETARPLLISDPRQGVVATLRNISKVPLQFFNSKTVFVLTPEADGNRHLRQGCALFPNVAKNGLFTLPPGELTRVFWDLRANECKPKISEMGWLDPFCAIDGLCENSIRGGQYKVVLNILFTEVESKKPTEVESKKPTEAEGKKLTEAEGKKLPEGGGTELHEHSASKDLELRVSSPFGWILCWSIVGGLCAYWVKAFVNLDPANKVNLTTKVGEFLTWQNVLALLGNGALSGVLVVIGTQLADTAFPIKVDASSVIGAFTSGFLLNFAGQRVITWLGSLK